MRRTWERSRALQRQKVDGRVVRGLPAVGPFRSRRVQFLGAVGPARALLLGDLKTATLAFDFCADRRTAFGKRERDASHTGIYFCGPGDMNQGKGSLLARC